MYVPTRLLVLRIKYKITLKALAGRMNIRTSTSAAWS